MQLLQRPQNYYDIIFAKTIDIYTIMCYIHNNFSPEFSLKGEKCPLTRAKRDSEEES